MPHRTLSRRDLLKGLSFAATSAALAACVPPPAVEKPADQPPLTAPPAKASTEIWTFLSQPGCPGGADPAKTDAVRQKILAGTGVKVNTYLAISTASAVEKLNLLLASGEPLDLFEGNWPDFKSALQPLNAALRQSGPNILRMNADVTWKRMRDWDGVTWGYPRLGLMGMTHFPIFAPIGCRRSVSSCPGHGSRWRRSSPRLRVSTLSQSWPPMAGLI